VRTAEPAKATGAPGKRYLADGGGLYLLVRSEEAKFWVFRYVRAGKLREMGLGPAAGRDAVPLAVAREKAAELRRLHKAGIDPLAQREADAARQRAEAQASAARAVTFEAVAELYISASEGEWRNDKHRQQWRNTLATYAFPVFGKLPVADVTTDHVVAALEPIWNTRKETASRLRGRIETVLDSATARGLRSGENPARWRGHLVNIFGKRSKTAQTDHHAALPWQQVAAFMAALATHEASSVAALALRFIILTAARSGEALGARWSEIDLIEAVWTVPGARMKAGKEHRVPLTAPALAVLRKAAKLRTDASASAFVFPGAKPGRPLSDMTAAMLLRRMNAVEDGTPKPWVDPRSGEPITVHGFRSCFRDWASEATAFDHQTAEAALAHTIRNKVESSYRRGDLFGKRRMLMEAWAAFCAAPVAPAGTVFPIRQKVAG
jgi:integrase